MKKRLLSALLALCMVLTLLPVSAFAAVSLAQGEYVKWIDRIDRLPDYAKNFYAILEEAVDFDGTKDYLIEDDYFTVTSGNELEDLKAGDIYYDADGNTTAIVAAVITEGVNASTAQAVAADAMAYIMAAYNAFGRDHNEVFWLNGASYCGASSATYEDSGTVWVLFYLSHSRLPGGDLREIEEDDIGTASGLMEMKISEILDVASGRSSRYDKIDWFNEWLTKNNQYNTGDVNNGPWDIRKSVNALVGSTGAKGPVCEGYARAFKVLCDRVGIPCVLVDGQATSDGKSSEAHMWNYVQMEDNKWYAVDVTWNDPVMYDSQGNRDDTAHGETDRWLLLGKNTLVASGLTFGVSHPETNQITQGGLEFTNGPKLSDTAYAKIEYKDGSIGWDAAPLKAGDTVNDPVTRTPTREVEVSTYTYKVTAGTLPDGLTLDEATGTISGTVKADVTEKIQVTITLYEDGNKTDIFTYATFPAVEADEPEVPTLEKPTDLSWNQDGYTIPTISGGASCGAGLMKFKMSNRDVKAGYYYQVSLYQKDTTKLVWQGMAQSYDNEFGISAEFILGDYDSGTYYFTVQAIAEDPEACKNSDIATSPDFEYTKPTTQLPQAAQGTWDWPNLTWTALDEDCSYAYEVYFSATKDGTPGLLTWTDIPVTHDAGAFLGDAAIAVKGPGYYSFRVRAISGDVTKAQNGPWSELSEPYAYKVSDVDPDEPGTDEPGTDEPAGQLKIVETAWDWPVAKWTVSDPDMVSGYEMEFFYSATEDGTQSSLMGHITVSPEENIETFVGRELKSGYYRFIVRAISKDPTQIQDSPWASSKLYHYVTVEDKVNDGLDGILDSIEDADGELDEDQLQALIDKIQEMIEELQKMADLLEAMQADNSNDDDGSDSEGVIDKLEQLEKKVANGRETGKDVKGEKAKGHFGEKDSISIVGAYLNVDNATDTVELVIDDTDSELAIPSGFDNENVVAFNLTLEVNDKPFTDKFKVPVQVTLPVPNIFADADPEQLRILHYKDSDVEVIKPHVGKDGKASFVVDHFSDFAMVLEKEIYEVVVFVSNGEGGTVSIKGTDGSRNAYYEKGTEVTVVAEASNGYRFVRWMLMTNDGPQELTTSKEYTFTVGEIFAFEFEDGLLHSLRADFERISSGIIPGKPTNPTNPGKPTDPDAPASVTIPSVVGGRLTSNVATARRGDTVTLTSKANAGYITAAPTVTDKDGRPVPVAKTGDGTWAFIMPEGGVTVSANYMTPAQMFGDLSDSAWYRNDLAFAVEHGLIEGSDGKFNPDILLTRGMMVTLLYKLEGRPAAPRVTFSDVPAGQYYTEAVAWAAANGIVGGYNNAFNPNGPLDVQSMATILYNYAAYKGYDVSGAADLSGYTDAGLIASWNLAGMRWANSVGVITGSNSALNPTGTSTRYMGAVLFAKFCREVVGMK